MSREEKALILIEYYRINEVRSAEKAMGIHHCGYRRTTSRSTGVRVGVDVNFLMRCTVHYAAEKY